ncbi:hypothetical protein [Streptomyces sp. NPDC059278]|uniref:hypothetical protein n=1 Tax=Streptomyces sp. NPDC059278 TaxID=3346801 RepID=UPI0036A576C0
MDWLKNNPESESDEAALALGSPLITTCMRLSRLEHEGRVQSAQIIGPFLDRTVYRAAPETTA